MANGKNPRTKVTKKDINESVSRFIAKLNLRLTKKGSYSYAGNHEALGLLIEEGWELIEAVKSNNDEHVAEELEDIGVGCIFAIAGMLAKNKIRR